MTGAEIATSVLTLGPLALALTSFVPAVAPAQQQAPASMVFDRVTIVDVERGKLVPNQRVVIVGNRIDRVGDVATVEVPREARVVDAKGKYLIPGLWDMHTHAQRQAHLFYPLFIANGVTGIRDAWSQVPLDTLVLWRDEILAGQRVGPPRQLLAGQPLGWEGSGLSVDDTAAVRRTVDSLRAAGANFLKAYSYFNLLPAAARRVNLPFGGHVEVGSAMDVSDSGMRILDHVMAGGGLDSLCLGSRVSSRASFDRCRAVAERFRQNNTWWVPTLIFRIGFFNRFHPTNPGAASDIVRDRLFRVAEQLGAGVAVESGWLHGAVSVGPPDSLRFLSIAKRADLPILAGTDASTITSEPPGFGLHAELAIYVTEGLTPLQALQAATLNPAKMLQATDSLGTVAPGKLADLLLLDADPLADITNTAAIRAVVANGRYFDRTALDRLTAEVGTHLAAAEVP